MILLILYQLVDSHSSCHFDDRRNLLKSY